jgi:UDP-glucose 4-epimerase
MASLIERKPKIEFLNRRNGDQSFTSGNTAKAEKHLGWESRTSFLSGIREQIEICKSGDCQKLAFKSF